FSQIAPPPPPTTLFPYTTLFRSAGVGQPPEIAFIRAAVIRALIVVRERAAVIAGDGRRARQDRRARQVPGVSVGAIGRRDQQVIDRKSTRLNSSHVAISYAVFCL